MYYGILGLAIGITIGIYAPLGIPVEWARYTAVGIMAILDSVFGAIRSDLQGHYKATIFLSGLVTNMILAMFLTYLGDRLGIDLYLAIIIAFTIRLLTNIGIIRYSFLTRFLGKREVEERLKAKAEVEG